MYLIKETGYLREMIIRQQLNIPSSLTYALILTHIFEWMKFENNNSKWTQILVALPIILSFFADMFDDMMKPE